MAKDLAQDHDLRFEYKSVEEEDVLSELKSKLPDAKTVPQIYWAGRYIGGYREFVKEIEDTGRDFGQGAF